MASANWLALIAKHASHGADLKVIAEAQTRQEVRGDWTSEGSGAYSRAWNGQSHPASIRADLGLYLGVSAVYANTTALTSRANLGAVQAAAEGFAWTGSTLYVKITGGLSPDNTALVTVHGLIRLATTQINFTDRAPYDARITGEQLPSVRQERPDLLRGISSFADGNLTLNNADGLFDYLAGPFWHWINNTVTFKLGGDALAYADYETVAVMQMAKPLTPGNRQAVLQLRSRQNALNSAFPKNRFDTFDFTLANTQDQVGQYFPMVFGFVFDAPLWLRAEDGGGLGYDRYYSLDPIHFGASNELQPTAVYAYPKAGGARQTVPTTDWNNGVVFGYIDINDAIWPTTDWNFTVDGLTATSGGAGLWYTCGRVAKEILMLCGVPAAEIDSASFDQADADNPAFLGIYVQGGPFTSVAVSGADLIDSPSRPSITKSTFCHVYLSAAGLWTAKVWDPSYAFTSLTQLTEREIFRFEPVPQVTEALVPNVTVHYQPRQFSGGSLTESSTSTEREVALGSTANEHVDTGLFLDAAAKLQAARLQLVSSHPVQQYAIEVGPVLMNANVGDKVRITRTRGPGAPTPSVSSGFDQVLEIESITKHLATQTVSAVVGNQRGLGMTIRQAAPDGVPAYASASDEEQMAYGFALDTATERADPADPATYHLVVAW